MNDYADWTHPIARFRRLRRGYPSPEDFRRMGAKRCIAYMDRIGFTKDAEDALARHRAEKAASS